MAFCDLVIGSKQLCPPGLSYDQCPHHFDCYVPCASTLAGTWISDKSVAGSPYGGQAYCEQFPRQPGGVVAAEEGLTQYEYWAQVGKTSVPSPNFDTIDHVGPACVYRGVAAYSWVAHLI